MKSRQLNLSLSLWRHCLGSIVMPSMLFQLSVVLNRGVNARKDDNIHENMLNQKSELFSTFVMGWFAPNSAETC